MAIFLVEYSVQTDNGEYTQFTLVEAENYGDCDSLFKKVIDLDSENKSHYYFYSLGGENVRTYSFEEVTEEEAKVLRRLQQLGTLYKEDVEKLQAGTHEFSINEDE